MSHDEKKCPFCSELIKLNAIKCKYCQSDIGVELVYQESNGLFKSINFYKTLKIVGISLILFLSILVVSNPKKSSFVHHIHAKVTNYANQNSGALGLRVASLISMPAVKKSITKYNFYAFSIFKVDPFLAEIIDENPKVGSPIYFLGVFDTSYYRISNGIAERLLRIEETDTSSTKKETVHSDEVVKLINEEKNLDSICRGTSGTKSEIACDKRDKIVYELSQRGWCYGNYGQASYEYEWHPCKTSSFIKK